MSGAAPAMVPTEGSGKRNILSAASSPWPLLLTLTSHLEREDAIQDKASGLSPVYVFIVIIIFCLSSF